jgi:radical SAM protein with 4Fe4S-binding SPASM domain
MRDLGCGQSPLWEHPDAAFLSAPLEVHFSVTNACSLRCGHCYMDSGERDEGEMSAEDFRKAIDLLAAMGVFHIAMGGGEALERPDFFELASYVRACGIVPNLTTNGLMLTKKTAEKCRIFGQVNISVDWSENVGTDGKDDETFAERVNGVDLLLEAGVNVGLNCVVTRQNFDLLGKTLDFAAKKGLTDVEFLRFKPSGRGQHDYFKKRLTPAQNRDFYPALKRFSQEYDVPAKIDCSFVPMFCWHRPDKALMEQFSVYGCEAGNVLLGVRSDGKFAGCSFLSGEESILALPRLWNDSKNLVSLRGWIKHAPEPCRSCEYLGICKGGCRAVSAFVSGDSCTPDPECPFVAGEYANSKARP